MMNIDKILAGLEEGGNLRTLTEGRTHGKYINTGGRDYLNLSSNDYLGLADDTELQKQFLQTAAMDDNFLMSSSSSRLMTGNGPAYRALEETLGNMYGLSCLVLGAGYAVNAGVLPAVTDKTDLILADKLVHASLIDGLRLCECRWERYRHNDMEHLEKLLRTAREKTRGDVWVVTESVFSMDGDTAPVEELAFLKEKYGFRLYIDEAHAFGVFGSRGRGLGYEKGLITGNDILIATFGKALASTGGFLVSSPETRELLVNRMRTLIYSTALPPLNLMWTSFILGQQALLEERRRRLDGLIRLSSPVNPGGTHIIPVMVGSNGAVKLIADGFREAGIWATPIRYPTVRKGTERVRLSLNAALDNEDILNIIPLCGTPG